jgi:hypothetical protein
MMASALAPLNSLGHLGPGVAVAWPLGPKALRRPLGPDNDAGERHLNTTHLYTTMLSSAYSNSIVFDQIFASGVYIYIYIYILFFA